MEIRTAVMADLAAVTAVEAACFPAAEAATERDFAQRLAVYPNHFWLLEEGDGTLVSFINGMVTDEPTLRAPLPPTGLCRPGDGAGHRRRPCPGAQGLRAHLQGSAHSLLRNVRLPKRGRVGLHPRRRGVVRHAPDVLREREDRHEQAAEKRQPGRRTCHPGGGGLPLLEGLEAGGRPLAGGGQTEKKINKESPRPGTFFISEIFSPGGSGSPPGPAWQGRE